VFCGQQCATYDVPLNIVSVDVPRDSGLGLEAAAREVRYKVLLEHAADALLLAHHQDDQAETLLLQLLRGAGVDGLAAMPVYGLRASASVMRPFLGFPRSVLETYARSKKLHWIEDESNQDPSYDRNFLRNEVFPVMERRFSAYRTTLARTAENLADAADLLAQVAEADAAEAVCSGKLDLRWMEVHTKQRGMNLLRWWVQAKTGLNPSRAWLLNSLDQLLNAKSNAQVQCKMGDFVLRRYRHWAYVDQQQEIQPYLLEWQGESPLVLPDGSRLTLKAATGEGIAENVVTQGLTVTNRAGAGNRWKMELRPDVKRPTRSLKNLWQEMGIPPWDRDSMPLVWSGMTLVAGPRIGVAVEAQAKGQQMGYRIEWDR
jgi:tRNA(Ile)-lysidine synthase